VDALCETKLKFLLRVKNLSASYLIITDHTNLK